MMSDDQNSDDYDGSYNRSDNSYLSDNDTENVTNTNDDINSDPDDGDNNENNNIARNNLNKSKNIKVKKIKKTPIKQKKLSLKEALKTVDERSLYTKIDRFFRECSEKVIQKMVKIIKNEDEISLRLLNWFSMKNSATMEPLEVINDDGKNELFDVKISYRARLNTHSKKYFDPFRRGRKFDYQYDKTDKTKVVETTLCQLNFFRWLIMHNLLDYVEEHFEALKNRMGTFNTVEKKKKEVKKEKEKIKKTILKNKKEDIKLKVKRFTEDNTNKLVIII
jgi:hypothetical protein